MPFMQNKNQNLISFNVKIINNLKKIFNLNLVLIPILSNL